MFVLSDKVGNPSINKPEGDSGDKGRKLTCASFVKYIFLLSDKMLISPFIHVIKRLVLTYNL